PPLPPRRRRRRRRSPTRTWASVSSTKRVHIYKRNKNHEIWWWSRNLAVIFSMGSILARWCRSVCVPSGFSDAVTSMHIRAGKSF
ncbi:60S acidic ribosomal protein P2, partial [Aspergillus udagawae]